MAMTSSRTLMHTTALALSLASVNLSATSQPPTSYPNKPVRLMLGPAPGSSPDIVVRVLAFKLSEAWGQQMVVDNRPGAGNTIAPTIAAKASPDGYTLLVC